MPKYLVVSECVIYILNLNPAAFPAIVYLQATKLHGHMINCSFLPVFYEHHQRIKLGKPSTEVKDYTTTEAIWMGFYGLGKFETFEFLYSKCKRIEDFEEWMISIKGMEQIIAAAEAFDKWTKGNAIQSDTVLTTILDDQQWQSWKDQGYIKISGLVDPKLCDAVSGLICTQLSVDLSNPETWYPNHTDWHGLMLQLDRKSVV